ncbi:MAG: CoA transferase, partial [Bradyrhizobiaceae bacterium]|nr:CoA transferase [Bradyrhizobiaceae bacterium]
DPHLHASGGLTNIQLTDGRRAKTPLLPVSMDGQRLQNRHDPPQIGQHTREVLKEIGLTAGEIARLEQSGTVIMTTT